MQDDEEVAQFGKDNAELPPDGGFMQDEEDFAPSLPAIDFAELHYAMASKWATQDAAAEEFSSQKVCTWLKNCISNVIDQYNYQVNKGGFESSKGW